MIEYKKAMHRNRPSRMNDAEIMVILILFHSGSFAVSSITTRNMSVNIWNTFFYVRFLITVLWNWRRKCYFPWLSSSRESCWEPVPTSVLSTLLLYVSAVTKESLFIRHLKDLPSVENVLWNGSSDSNCIW